MGLKITLVGSIKKKETLHLLELRGRYQCSDYHFSGIKVRYGASVTAGTEREEDAMARSAALREQLTEEGRDPRALLMKREN